MFTFPIFLLTASVAIVGSNALALSPIAGAVARSFPGITAADVMVASAAYGIATAASALLLAPSIDKMGAKRALEMALILLAIAMLLTAAAPSLWLLCGGQVLAGIAAGIALPASYGLSAELAPKGQESKTLGLVLTGWTLSLVIGVSLSALIADFFHWRGAFAAMGLLAVLILLGLKFASSREKTWSVAANYNRATSPLTALRVPGILSGLMVSAAFMTPFYGVYSYLGAHLQEALGLSPAIAGIVSLLYGIGFGCALFFTPFIDRHGSKKVAVFVFIAAGLIYLSIALVTASFYLLVAFSFFWGLINHLGLNLIVGRLTALDPGQRGAIMGLNSTVTYLCVFIGAVGFRPLYELSGLSVCALVASLCVLPAIIDGLQRRREAGQADANPA
ncbi:MFS transporter [Kiloniella laminariae]|uniref:MFS transporter n=1 Tax=Kiloniella laminariae TaxID=454162 RepID=UPI00037264A2|nr:MFS transporter [Kiloniella laminariae]